MIKLITREMDRSKPTTDPAERMKLTATHCSHSFLSCYPAFFLMFFLSTFFLSCAADKQQAVARTDQVESRRVTDKYSISRDTKSPILLKSIWGESIALDGCVGIFAGENPANLEYEKVVKRIDKELGININNMKRMEFDEINKIVNSEHSRNIFFSNGIQSISIRKSSFLQISIGFYRLAGSDRIHVLQAAKIAKKDWIGKPQLAEEKLDIEFLSSGKLYHARFEKTHAQKQKSKTQWYIIDENLRVMQKEQTDQMTKSVRSLMGYLCGQAGLRYVLIPDFCQ